MSKIPGRLVDVGLAIPGTRGAGASPSMWLPQTNISLVPRTDDVRITGALGVLADSEEKIVAEKYADGDIEGELRSETFGYFLYGLFGSLSTTGSDPYTHAFSIQNDSQGQDLVVVVKDDNAEEMYKLAMVESLEISSELDSPVMFTAGMISKAPATTTQTRTNTSEVKFTKKDVCIKVADDIASLSEATALDIKSLTLSFEKGVERDSTLCTAEPVDILQSMMSISGTLVLNWEAVTYRDYMLNGTEKALKVKIEESDGSLSGDENAYFEIDLPKVDFSGFELDRSLDTILRQTINFKANYDSTNGLVESCTLYNATDSY